MRHLFAPVAAVVALVLAFPTLAPASPQAVLRDCGDDGDLDGSYSDADKRAALDQMQGDQAEYSDCGAVISSSIGSGTPKAGASSNDSGAAGAGAGAGAATAASAKAEKRRKARVQVAEERRRAKRTQAALGDHKVDPRDVGAFEAADTSNGLPLPVILALVALALLCVAAALVAVSRRNPGLAGALRRVPFPRPRR